MEQGRFAVEQWDEHVMDEMKWDNTTNEKGEIVCLGRKYLAMYVYAQSLSMGFEVTTSAALAERTFGVPSATLLKNWYKWLECKEEES